MKVCNNCKIEKELIEFNKDKGHKDGHIGKCKVCISEYNKQYQLILKKERQEDYEIYKLKKY
jgi:hypothetical protein